MCVCAHKHCTLQLVHCYTLHTPAQTATRIIRTRASVKKNSKPLQIEVNEKRNSHCKAHTKTLITEGSEENTPVLVCIISTLHIFLNLKKMDRYHTARTYHFFETDGTRCNYDSIKQALILPTLARFHDSFPIA